ncbi:arginase family protein [Desmospora profundinema]|uniref:Arginase family enzyme n=1 Tax=Desmospora profundinema TaxID=1571184 RepID=A0ABU1IK31_9BACL|nr:arginase family protein [Desmospora profundinema]MDR6224748.1 arginase family enzyme [Desmospora profundinema]
MKDNWIGKVDEHTWEKFHSDPLPGWGSRYSTIFNVEHGKFNETFSHGDTAVASIPFDSTASTRIGARYGPRAIRESSLAYSEQVKSWGVDRFRHMRTGELLKSSPTKLVDFGDCHVYPTDPLKQMRATAAEVYYLSNHFQRIVLLGGDHSISFGCFYGFASQRQQIGLGKIGYLQIDHHFDFGSHSVLHGPVYHGSNARRISEHDLVSLDMMAFVGVGDLTSAKQYENLLRSGVIIKSMGDIRREGFESCLRSAMDKLTEKVDCLYVSIDIDVCDSSVASGTGHVTVGGLRSEEFLTIASVLRDYPVAALDIVEVSPHLDQSGVTAYLAARLLFEWLYLDGV